MAAEGFTELVLPPGFTTAPAAWDLSLLSRTPEELSWRVCPLDEGEAVEGFLRLTLPEEELSLREGSLRETLPLLSREEFLRVTPLEEEVFCRELVRPPLTDDEFLSEVLRPNEELLSEEELPRFIVEVLLSEDEELMRLTEERLSDEDLLLSAEELLREEDVLTEEDLLL